jgi:hypothetical protein
MIGIKEITVSRMRADDALSSKTQANRTPPAASAEESGKAGFMAAATNRNAGHGNLPDSA